MKLIGDPSEYARRQAAIYQALAYFYESFAPEPPALTAL